MHRSSNVQPFKKKMFIQYYHTLGNDIQSEMGKHDTQVKEVIIIIKC